MSENYGITKPETTVKNPYNYEVPRLTILDADPETTSERVIYSQGNYAIELPMSPDVATKIAETSPLATDSLMSVELDANCVTSLILELANSLKTVELMND